MFTFPEQLPGPARIGKGVFVVSVIELALVYLEDPNEAVADYHSLSAEHHFQFVQAWFAEAPPEVRPTAPEYDGRFSGLTVESATQIFFRAVKQVVVYQVQPWSMVDRELLEWFSLPLALKIQTPNFTLGDWFNRWESLHKNCMDFEEAVQLAAIREDRSQDDQPTELRRGKPQLEGDAVSDALETIIASADKTEISAHRPAERLEGIFSQLANSKELKVLQSKSFTGEQKMRRLLAINAAYAGKKSPQWQELLGVKAATIRGYATWTGITEYPEQVISECCREFPEYR